jgi:hypothetical protein
MFNFYLFSPNPQPTVLSFFPSQEVEKHWKIRGGLTIFLFTQDPLGGAVEKNLMFLTRIHAKPCDLNIPTNRFSRKSSLCTVVHKNVHTCCLPTSVQCLQYHIDILYIICTVSTRDDSHIV